MTTWKQLTREEARALDCLGWAVHVEDQPVEFEEALAHADVGTRIHAVRNPSVPSPEVLAKHLANTLVEAIEDDAYNDRLGPEHPYSFLVDFSPSYGDVNGVCLNRQNKEDLAVLLERVAEWLITVFPYNANYTWFETGCYYTVTEEDLETC